MKKSLITLALLAAASSAHAAGEAKNVIFFLGDGMGPTTVTATRLYKVGEAGKLAMELERVARIKTFSADAQTTDSAPSMAAYMTGVKMNNEVIAMSADTQAQSPKSGDSQCAPNNGKPVETLFELAKAKGKAVGAVSTASITHATPAATYAHICHRDAENSIAIQAVPGGAGYNAKLGSGVDVLLGGGAAFWIPKANGGRRNDGRDLIAEMKAQGYTWAGKGTELAALDAKASDKLFGLFTPTHMDYELDRVKKSLDQPSLAEMTVKAIEVLEKKAEGYVLMVEAGRIDHALHGTNAKRVLEDTVAFDAAIAAALAKVDLKNTLIVVTADHDHTLTMNGYGKKGSPILGTTKNYDDGREATDVNGVNHTTLVFGNGPNRPDVRLPLVEGDADKSQVLHDDYRQETGVRLSSETHGGGDVMLMATGAGASRFKGTLDNTEVFGLLKAASGL